MVAENEHPIKLEVFEGPLDLLLFLIRKSEVDIYDIPIAEVLKQYLDILFAMKELQLEVAGDFFVMAASLMSPLLMQMDLSDARLTLVVVAIAAGAAGFSHVNDSGFWMVSRYFRMSEKETFQTWSLVSTAVGIIGVIFASILWVFVG